MIAAILRAQWLSMRLGARCGVSAAVTRSALVRPLVSWRLRRVAGWAAHASADPAAARTCRRAAAGVFVYWQVVPMLSASMGAALDMRKLLVYPDSARQAVPGGSAAAPHHRHRNGAGAHRRHRRALAEHAIARLGRSAASRLRRSRFSCCSTCCCHPGCAVAGASAHAPQSARTGGVPDAALVGAAFPVRRPDRAPSGWASVVGPCTRLACLGRRRRTPLSSGRLRIGVVADSLIAAGPSSRPGSAAPSSNAICATTRAAQATPVDVAVRRREAIVERFYRLPVAVLARSAGGHGREGTAFARAHAAFPHGLRHGLHFRPDGVAAHGAGPRKPSHAHRAIF